MANGECYCLNFTSLIAHNPCSKLTSAIRQELYKLLLKKPYMRTTQLTLLFTLASFLTYAQESLEPARKKLQSGDFAGVKSDLTKIIDSNPKNKEALNLRGEARAG